MGRGEGEVGGGGGGEGGVGGRGDYYYLAMYI